MLNPIRISTVVRASPARAWRVYVDPAEIIHWNAASDDWHCPAAVNDLQVGGHFSYTMAARDGSFQFDFGGQFTAVEPERRLAYALGDGRAVEVTFTATDGGTRVETAFEAEGTHPRDMQQQGWQAILDRFAAHAAG